MNRSNSKYYTTSLGTFVKLPSFEPLAAATRALSGTSSVPKQPIVTQENRNAWEQDSVSDAKDWV
jgi:hypothetical protein